MRANEWTDWELVKFLAKAFDEGECGIGYDLKLMRGDRILKIDQNEFGYRSWEPTPASMMKEKGIDPKSAMFLVDDTDNDFFMLDRFEDVRSALREIENKSTPCDEEKQAIHSMTEWMADEEGIIPLEFTSEYELMEFLMTAKDIDPNDRYWYGEIENFNGETYTAEEVLEDMCPEWFEDGQKMKLHIFCGCTKNI